ncbi:MAG: substrate-binding domain-containing protein [Treponemataceae bacterium]|nr:substrate-binding domain-containing protein [Treponemataceae bacterium]
MKKLANIAMRTLGMTALCASLLAPAACKSRKESIVVSGSSSVTPIMERLAAEYEKTHDVRITINMSSSGAGISDTQNGLNDFGMSSRELKESEKGVAGRTLCIDGIACTAENIMSGTYALQRPFVIVLKENAKLSVAAQGFYDYI